MYLHLDGKKHGAVQGEEQHARAWVNSKGTRCVCVCVCVCVSERVVRVVNVQCVYGCVLTL